MKNEKEGIMEVLIILMAVLLAGIYVGTASAATPISTCGAISSPGEYVLSQNIVNDTEPICIYINSSDVVFNGDGRTIDGVQIFGGSKGVYVDNVNYALQNVTVRNLVVKNWSDGINYFRVSNGTIENNTAISNYYGIHIWSSSNNNLTSNTANSNYNGIYLYSSSNYNNLTNNIAESNSVGIHLQSAENNIIYNNTANLNSQYGISLFFSSQNNLTGNTVTLNPDGIRLWQSDNNNLTENNASSNTNSGIKLEGSSYNILRNNTALNNSVGIDITQGSFTIEAYNGTWQTVGVEHFPGRPYPDRYTTKTIELPHGTTSVRLTHNNTETAHIDAALLDGNAPITVIDRSSGAMLPPSKLAEADYDIIDAVSRTIEIAWASPGTNLTLTAVEEDIDGVPVSWPVNDYLNYTLGAPQTFSRYIIPYSSHPASTYYLTFRNSSSDLFLYLDATGDNTNDVDGDWAELRIPVENGIKKFRIHATDTTWGTSAYEYTDKVAWQHKTYNFSIPLGEIVASGEGKIKFQIGYYGTVVAQPSRYNTLINNTVSFNTQYGIRITSSSNDNTIEGNLLDLNNNGIYTEPSSNPAFGNVYRGNTITNTTLYGIYLSDGFDSNDLHSMTIEYNQIITSTTGIYLKSDGYDIYNITIKDNTVSNASSYGIYLNNGGAIRDNYIYNNIFNNSNNARIDANNNIWNITKTSGTNIVGGSYLGGNFWAYPNGTGFSQTCADVDGICDSQYALDANNIDYLPLSLNFTSRVPEIPTPIPVPQASGSSSGTGGGGVSSSEPIENIERCGNKTGESISKHLVANSAVRYPFTPCEGGIYEILATGLENEYDVALRVEHLNGLSMLVAEPAPGTVYYYVNVWSGTEKIKEALIRFRAENSWITSNGLTSNDVKALRWDGNKWQQLEMAEIKKDSAYTYYEAKTPGFSSFAITGLKEDATPTATALEVTGATNTGNTNEIFNKADGTNYSSKKPLKDLSPGSLATPLAIAIGITVIIGLAATSYGGSILNRLSNYWRKLEEMMREFLKIGGKFTYEEMEEKIVSGIYKEEKEVKELKDGGELKRLFIAGGIIFLAFALELYPHSHEIEFEISPIVFLLALAFFTMLAEIGHDLAIKFSLRSAGGKSAFELSLIGVPITIVSGILGFVITAAGGTKILYKSRNPQTDAIVVSFGSLFNLIFGVFLLIISVFFHIEWLAFAGALPNLAYAVFCLFPTYPFEGRRVFKGSKGLWSMLFSSSMLFYIYILL